MTKEEIEKKAEEYDLVIRFKSNKPKYEIRGYIINQILDEFDNLQMWDFKRSSEFAEQREKRIADLENKIADIKANCDLAIEGRDIKIKELEKENERLKGDLELWESGGCRATNLFECGVVKELKEQIEKMKRHCNCKHRDSEGYCEVKRTYLMDLSYDGCDKWELEETRR